MKPGISSMCLTPDCKNAASKILQYMDPKVAPCDDFYKFACGNFIKSTVIPKDDTRVQIDDSIDDKVMQQLKIIIEEPIKSNEPRWAKTTKSLYNACMNTNAIEKNSFHKILAYFNKLGGWPVLEDSWKEKDFDWKQATYDMKKWGFETDFFFTCYVDTGDEVNWKSMILIDQTYLAIGCEYFIKGFTDKKVQAYYDLMVEVAVIFGAKRTRAEKELKESLEFEMKLGVISGTYDPPTEKQMSVKELSKKYPSIPWKEYFSTLFPSAAIDDYALIRVIMPSFFDKFETLMKKTPKRVLANYLLWRAILDSGNYLNSKIFNLTHEFYGAISEAKWRTCLHFTNKKLGTSFGALYVRKFFNKESKKSAEELAANIEQQFKKILKEVDWMDEKTKRNALVKLESINNLIGYPDELFDNKKLDEFYMKLEITPDDYLQAVLNMTIFLKDKLSNQLRYPVKRLDWTSHSAIAFGNTVYKKEENSISIYAGRQQDIFLHKDRPQYLNYARLGVLLAREITHGFDWQGSLFGKNGDPEDWWTKETEENVSKKADCIIKQYGNYTAEEVGLKLNANKVAVENIADNGGVKISYLAYQDWLKKHGPELKLPGLNYSQTQLFWIQAAIQHCAKYTKESLKNDIMTSDYSPAKFRVLGTFSNRPEFSKDFNCPRDSTMNPVKKCSVWFGAAPFHLKTVAAKAAWRLNMGNDSRISTVVQTNRHCEEADNGADVYHRRMEFLYNKLHNCDGVLGDNSTICDYGHAPPATENRVTLLWIPKHNGIKGNEISDRLEKLAAKENVTGPEPVVDISRRLVTADINSWLTEGHQNELGLVSACRLARTLSDSKLNSHRAKKFLKLARNEVKVLIEMLIGHGNLRYHRYNIGLEKRPLCRLCGKDNENSTYIVCHCPAIAGKRVTVAGRYCINESGIPAKSGAAVLFPCRGLWGHA
ncbi:neprilysin-2-like [Belonocnema kinseyi]|uniref:neprilysin-2-like n=1 Tax=Belonocnema kinseyi TaxID=2817044 RepID=UPI00143D310F|nr:neprilysin-2-like [Belonocnema kinseyi]